MTSTLSSLQSEAELLQQQVLNLRGKAKVRLRHLKIESDGEYALDGKNIKRLLNIYKIEGCHRLEPEHHVPVLISRHILDGAIQRSGLQAQSLYDPANYPLLELGEDDRLQVLHGRHRLHAAAQFLSVAAGQWWVVDMYDDQLPQASVFHLRESYANSKTFSDGDIYRQIRLQELKQNPVRAGKWRARLSAGKLKDLKQMNKHQIKLRDALDTLLPFVGLWSVVELGTWHRLLTNRCPEELVRYLTKVYEIWDVVLLGRDDLRYLLDPFTVRTLETLVPGVAKEDARICRDLMLNGTLFPRIQDESTRAQILVQLEQLEQPVLSLFTFLEDTKLLELGMKPLRLLLPGLARGSEGDRFLSMYEQFLSIHENITGDSELTVQRSERSFITLRCSGHLVVHYYFYQLFLNSVRDFVALTGVTPRKEKGKPKPITPVVREKALWCLADLAHRFGFQSGEIRAIRNSNPEMRMVTDFLHQLRPSEHFEYDAHHRQALASEICDRISDVPFAAIAKAEPIFTTDLAPKSKDRRCGRPYEDDQRRDRQHFFIERMSGVCVMSNALYMTSLAYRRFTFIAFFGLLELVGSSKPTDSMIGAGDDCEVRDTSTNQHIPVDPSSWDALCGQKQGTPTHDLSASKSDLPNECWAACGLSEVRHNSVDMVRPLEPEREQYSPLNLSGNTHFPAADTKTSLSPLSDLEDFVQEHINTVVQPMRVYIYGQRGYRSFEMTDLGRQSFAEVTAEQANLQRCFFVLTSPHSVEALGVEDLWVAAQPFKLVIVLKKDDICGQYFTGTSLEALLEKLKSATDSPPEGHLPVFHN